MAYNETLLSKDPIMKKLSRENVMVVKAVAARLIVPVALVTATYIIVKKLDKTPAED
jgi:hypothetical protein